MSNEEIGNVGNIPFLSTILKLSSFSIAKYSPIGLSPLCRSILEVLISFPANKKEILEAKCARLGIAKINSPFFFIVLSISRNAFFVLRS